MAYDISLRLPQGWVSDLETYLDESGVEITHLSSHLPNDRKQTDEALIDVYVGPMPEDSTAADQALANYADTVGFDDDSANNSYVRCYSDQFSTGWLFGPKSDNADLDGCICYWYDSTPGKRHTAIRCEGRFTALVDDLWAGFRDTKATNAVLLVGEAGGHGVLRDLRLREDRLNAADDAFRDHLRGTLHP